MKTTIKNVKKKEISKNYLKDELQLLKDLNVNESSRMCVGTHPVLLIINYY